MCDRCVPAEDIGPTVQDTRNFSRFSDAAHEVVDARVLLGIHFRFADEVARTQGKKIAHFGFKNYLRPVKGADDVDEALALRTRVMQ